MGPSVTRSRIFIVDDHPLVREWLTTLIDQTTDLMICGEAEDLSNALHGIALCKPDLAIVDLSLGGDSGFELIRTLKEQFPAVATVVLSMHEEPEYAERAIRAGARGYIVKRESTTKIVEAIHLALNGNIYLSQELTERLMHRLALDAVDGGPPTSKLSNRELEVFQLIGRGYDNREIADALKVNIKTIQTYCTRIKEKLELGSGAELVRKAMRWNGARLVR